MCCIISDCGSETFQISHGAKHIREYKTRSLKYKCNIVNAKGCCQSQIHGLIICPFMIRMLPKSNPWTHNLHMSPRFRRSYIRSPTLLWPSATPARHGRLDRDEVLRRRAAAGAEQQQVTQPREVSGHPGHRRRRVWVNTANVGVSLSR